MSESGKIDGEKFLVWSAKTESELLTATHYLDQKIQRENNQYDRFVIGNHIEYSKQCRALYSNFQNTFRPVVAERLVKVCMLKPARNSLSPVEMKTVHELAEIVSGFQSYDGVEWLFFSRPLSELRRNHTNETLKWTQRCRDSIPSEKANSREILLASTHIVDALALHHTRNIEQSKKSEEKATPGWLDSTRSELSL
ncbi:MAG: hypothetical protein AB8B55_20345 [Mariniblastus sp.]